MKHIVLIKLNESCSLEEVYSNAYKLSKDIKEKNDFIVSISLNKNIIKREGNYDLILVVELKDTSFFENYLNSTEHKDFSNYLKPYALSKIKIDF